MCSKTKTVEQEKKPKALSKHSVSTVWSILLGHQVFSSAVPDAWRQACQNNLPWFLVLLSLMNVIQLKGAVSRDGYPHPFLERHLPHFYTLFRCWSIFEYGFDFADFSHSRNLTENLTHHVARIKLVIQGTKLGCRVGHPFFSKKRSVLSVLFRSL